MAGVLSRERVNEIAGQVEAFCDAYLSDEYKDVCLDMLQALLDEKMPLQQGKAAGWAGGVVYSVGFVNFLGDPGNTPHMTGKQVAEGMGISEATLMAKARVIRKRLDIIRFDPAWTIDSMLERNPLIWFVEINGIIYDLRSAPFELKKRAFEAGWIPFIPEGEEASEHSINSPDEANGPAV